MVELLLPAADVEPTYIQHEPAVPYRHRALVRTASGSTLSINVSENFWGALPDEMDQREIGGTDWVTTVEDSNRGYVTTRDARWWPSTPARGNEAPSVGRARLSQRAESVEFEQPK